MSALQTVCPKDQARMRAVAEKVFSAYDGGREQWGLENSEEMWTIHFGKSAGVVGVDLDGRRLCAKLFYDDRLKSRIRNFFRCSKAQKSYRNGIRLNEVKVSAPKMLAYAENPQGMGLIITELAEGFERVDRRVERQGAEESLARALGQFIRQMHDAGVTHKDLSLRNVLVKGAAYEFILLDYEDASFFKTVPEAARMENLHHLNERALATVFKEIRRAFLCAYLQEDESLDHWCDELNQLIDQNPSKYTQGRHE